MSESRSAICLVIDRLSSAYVGAYGNTWIHTPAFDRLASQSMVFSRAMIDSPDLAETYYSFWSGQPAWQRALRAVAPATAALPERPESQCVPSVLLTDATEIAEHPLATFDEIIRVPMATNYQQTEDWEDTQAASFFASAIELVNVQSMPALVWLHCSALGRIWDSPRAFRNQYSAPEDPAASETIEPPSLLLGDDPDPDRLLGLRHAYAGEVTAIDRALSMLLDAIDRSDWRSALLAVVSPRGYPLGEHGIVGDAANALYGELVQVPWMVRMPGLPRFGVRSQALAQPADICTTMRDWCRGNVSLHPSDPFAGHSLLQLHLPQDRIRDLALARSSTSEMAIATPSWFLRATGKSVQDERHVPATEQGDEPVRPQLELFVKPDDYFEVNDVATRCPDVVDEFQQLLNSLECALAASRVPELIPSCRLKEHVDAFQRELI